MTSVNDLTISKIKQAVNYGRRKSKNRTKWRHKHKSHSSNGHGGGLSHLPTWAKVLIIVTIVIVACFIAGFAYYLDKERKRFKATGKPIRWKKVFWGATKIGFFLWIPIYIYRAIKYRSWKGERGSYDEIDPEQARLDNAAPETKPWDMNQAPANADAKYEPMGYNSTVYDPYSAYTGVNLNPPTTSGLHQPPPPHETGGLGSRTPSPPRNPYESPSQPPPTYTGY